MPKHLPIIFFGILIYIGLYVIFIGELIEFIFLNKWQSCVKNAFYEIK